MLDLVFAVTLAANPAMARDVLAAESVLNAAVARHDAAATARLVTSDYVLVVSSGRIVTHDAFLRAVADRSFAYTKNAAHDQHVRFYGDRLAVVTGILEQQGTQGGKRLSIPVVYTDTWVREGNAWFEAAGEATRASTLKR